jgi:hypothetical protein
MATMTAEEIAELVAQGGPVDLSERICTGSASSARR